MIERLKCIFAEWIRYYAIYNRKTLTILFTIDEENSTEIVWRTLAELKPIYDMHGGNLEFDELDKKASEGILPIYMPFDSFYKLYEKLLADLSGIPDDNLLLAMIEFDEANNIGHHVFLRYVYAKRNSYGS